MWAFAIYDLGLSDEGFWKLTLKRFAALAERYHLSIERQHYHAALICAVLANIHRDPKKSQPFSPADFMPGYRKKEPQTPQQMLNVIQMYQCYFEVKDG